MSCYLHHVPGRIRIKCATLKGPARRIYGIEGRLASHPGVSTVTGNALTGSIVVHYDQKITRAGKIIDILARECNIDISTAVDIDSYVDERLSRTGRKISEKMGKALLGVVIGQVFEGSPLALLAAVI